MVVKHLLCVRIKMMVISLATYIVDRLLPHTHSDKEDDRDCETDVKRATNPPPSGYDGVSVYKCQLLMLTLDQVSSGWCVPRVQCSWIIYNLIN